MTEQLKGLICFVKPLQLPAVPGLTPEQYLQGRLHSAQRLAAYQIMANLRSSRAALIEHILGTEAACQQLGIIEPPHKPETGNIIARLEERSGQPPDKKLGITLPDWLSDPDAHRQACQEEIAIYRAILDQLDQLSSHREEAKAHRLITLLKNHNLVLAFDRRLITLAELRQRIQRLTPDIDVQIATGSSLRGKATVRTAMALGSDIRNLIALCSDSMSEGINLQQASTMVHLDMPSVVRIAEQRVGRVDRMDNPHKEIEVWWPDDGEAFRLRADERFIERYQTVDSLLGSNLPLPEAMHQAKHQTLSSRDMIAALEREQEAQAWDGLQDAFAPVRALVEGDDALVSQETYAHYRGRIVRVLSRVSVVASQQPWAFFCIAGDRQGAPKWMLFTDRQTMPLTQLQSISEQLQTLLGTDVQSLNVLDETARYWLDRFLNALRHAERQLLPRRKQCALEEMAMVIGKYQKMASQQGDQRAVDFYQKLLGVLQGETSEVHPDWHTFADCWLDLIRPAWYIGLKRPRRRRPLFLKDIRQDLLDQPLDFEAIHRAFRSIPTMKALEDRVVACILGAPHRQSGS